MDSLARCCCGCGGVGGRAVCCCCGGRVEGELGCFPEPSMSSTTGFWSRFSRASWSKPRSAATCAKAAVRPGVEGAAPEAAWAPAPLPCIPMLGFRELLDPGPGGTIPALERREGPAARCFCPEGPKGGWPEEKLPEAVAALMEVVAAVKEAVAALRSRSASVPSGWDRDI